MDPYGSALATLPVVFSRFALEPKTVIDVGCGDGSWLKAAWELGVEHCVGIGNDSVYLQAPPMGADRYRCIDLAAHLKDPYTPDPDYGKYDLAICLEVAEHLPLMVGPNLIRMLSVMSPVILFSAAQPGQGPYPPPDATDENRGRWHINEQAPQYWGLEFRRLGYEQRPLREIRDDQRIDPWYRENAYLYVRMGEGVGA